MNELLQTELFTSLGLPQAKIHHGLNHFDFTKAQRKILVIGPMGSGKTEFSARVVRDARIVLKKSSQVEKLTSQGNCDRRRVVFVRSELDLERFKNYPPDALAYRGGFEQLGEDLIKIRSSFDLEQALKDRPDAGTWIIDEAIFYDERIAYIVDKEARVNGRIFIFPTLILNFRREVFNQTAKLLMEIASDVLPLTAYCEAESCMKDSLFTYRYYSLPSGECPAPYFDPLVIIGGDSQKQSGVEPNYATRCELHYYLPGKEYTFLVLKPLALEASRGKIEPLFGELLLLNSDPENSSLAHELSQKYEKDAPQFRILLLPMLAERALLYIYMEQNLISHEIFIELYKKLELDENYLSKRLKDAGRTIPD